MLIERLDENWYYCANEGDEEGIVLANNIKVVRKLPDEGGQIISADKPFAVAIHNYSSSVDGDLSFKKGDVIFLVRYLSETWLEGELEGTKVIGVQTSWCGFNLGGSAYHSGTSVPFIFAACQ